MILKTELFEHQKKAVEKLKSLKVGALYMEMGTGKTRTALELIKMRLDAGKVERVLWLCPCNMKTNLKRDLQKHCDDISPIMIAGIESLSSSLRLNCELYNLVTTYKTYLVVDESNLVKNPFALRTRNIDRIAAKCSYKLILNGTPISKCEKDLYAQWHILDWRILGYQTFWSFAANHLEYDDRIPGKISKVLNVDYLTHKIAPYTYQIKKSECLDLPSKTYEWVYFELTDYQRFHYHRICEEFMEYIISNGERDTAYIYKYFTALQNITSGMKVISSPGATMKTVPLFDKPEDNPRIIKLLEILSDITEKTIIWCKYTHEIKAIHSVLPNSVCFYGEMSPKERNESLELFSKDKDILIANKSCGGYGLNLQFCHYMIYYSNDWDWATRAQSEDRVHRIGQNHNVHIIDLIADCTIDERIIDSLARKENLVKKFQWEIRNQQKSIKEIMEALYA